MNKFMRVFVFFDLPVTSKSARTEATRFRNFLISDGFHMLQYSIYVRICNGSDAVEMHKNRVKRNLPHNGSVRVLTVTERQYEAMEILLGPFTMADNPKENEQLSLF